MNLMQVIAAVATSVGVIAFAAIFTVLYRGYTNASIKELKTGKRDIELMDAYIYEMQKSYRIRKRIASIVKGICFENAVKYFGIEL